MNFAFLHKGSGYFIALIQRENFNIKMTSVLLKIFIFVLVITLIYDGGILNVTAASYKRP
jgi:hypothetical protein